MYVELSNKPEIHQELNKHFNERFAMWASELPPLINLDHKNTSFSNDESSLKVGACFVLHMDQL